MLDLLESFLLVQFGLLGLWRFLHPLALESASISQMPAETPGYKKAEFSILAGAIIEGLLLLLVLGVEIGWLTSLVPEAIRDFAPEYTRFVLFLTWFLFGAWHNVIMAVRWHHLAGHLSGWTLALLFATLLTAIGCSMSVFKGVVGGDDIHAIFMAATGFYLTTALVLTQMLLQPWKSGRRNLITKKSRPRLMASLGWMCVLLVLVAWLLVPTF